MNRRHLLRLLAVLALAPWLGPLPASSQLTYLDRVKIKQSGKPNIILIVADDLGYGDLGCYGQKRIQTPNLDRLAAEGMRFTQVYAGSTVCAPSRATLMTGLHTGHVRIRGNAKMPLEPDDETVARLLQRAGYRTGGVGKWGLGLENTSGHPNRQGFDEWRGFLDQTHAHNYYPEFIWANDRKVVLSGNQNNRKGDYVHDLFTKSALNFIGVNREFAFFLYVAFTIPHANNELTRATGMGMEVPSDEPYGAEKWPQAEKNKAAMITRMDRDVGKILDTLKTQRIDEDTAVFFTSDNGPHQEGGNDPKFFESSGSLRGIKRDLYEGGIRVPMIVRWPGRVRAGSVSDQVWAFWDFLPTAAEMAGLRAPGGSDGISMLPTLTGQKQTNQHEFLYWEFHERGSKQAVRMGNWKAVRTAPGQALELYDLNTDLTEQKNVASGHAEVVARIEEYLKTARSESEDWPLKPPPLRKDPASPARGAVAPTG